jgi:glycerophosphoryl diester phosphodiesterase
VVALARTLRRRRALDRVCIGAFSDARICRIRSLVGPRVCTAAGPRETAALAAAARLGRVPTGPVPYDCLQVPVRHRSVEIVTPALVEAAHRLGVQVHVWTIDEAGEMERLLDLGVDGLFTDVPSVLRRVLERRGEWR